MDVDAWKERVEAERRHKDAFFASDSQSPIPLEGRRAFSGLAYYPPDPAYRFELELHEHADKDVRDIQDTAGNVRQLLRWGEFRFELAGRQCVLQVYKSRPYESTLFIPFKDATSGAESYGAGRYLDLNPAEHLTKEGKWVLDLNAAYNPWCAYSQHYACPFVPPENWLDVPVRAGEKNYPLKPAEESK